MELWFNLEGSWLINISFPFNPSYGGSIFCLINTTFTERTK